MDFDSLVTAERFGLVRYFDRTLRDAGSAEDLTQETLLRAARGWAAFRGDCSPRTWLRRIATRVLHDHWRNDASGQAENHQTWTQADDLVLADRQESPALSLERRQVRTCLGDLVARLPAGEQEVLLLAVRDAIPPREIARNLHLTPEAARARLHRARRKLAGMVADRCILAADEAGALSCEARILPATNLSRSPGHVPPA